MLSKPETTFLKYLDQFSLEKKRIKPIPKLQELYGGVVDKKSRN